MFGYVANVSECYCSVRLFLGCAVQEDLIDECLFFFFAEVSAKSRIHVWFFTAIHERHNLGIMLLWSKCFSPCVFAFKAVYDQLIHMAWIIL